MRVRSAAAIALLLAVPAYAQSKSPGGMPPPPGMALAQSAAMRFPQPVRVGDLPGRPVLEPTESQTVLGSIKSIVQDSAGRTLVVIDLAHWFGLATRTVAVPVDAMVLVGDAVEIVAYTPDQLWTLPTFDAPAATALPAGATIKVGLAKPSH